MSLDVASTKFSPLTLVALYYNFIVHIAFITDRAVSYTVTRSTLCVVVYPITAKSRIGRTTISTVNTPASNSHHRHIKELRLRILTQVLSKYDNSA